MGKILVIDDDKGLCRLLGDGLGLEGFACAFAHSGIEGINRLQNEVWDLLVLDIMLPGCSGYDVLRFVRNNADTAALPVLMLTAKSDELDRINGLESGADDYLTKPFSLGELAARIRAVLRRSELSLAHGGVQSAPSITVAGNLSLNRTSRRVRVNDEIVPITPLEFQLLEILLENIGETVPRERLSQEVLGHGLNPLERTIDVHVSRIRNKIGSYPDGSPRIRSVRGEGYIYLLQEEA